MTQNRVRHWDGVYGSKAPEAVSWYQAEPAPSLAAIAKTGLGPETPFIDIGGGASALAARLRAQGWRDLSVLDVSAAALDVARSRMDGGDEVDWVVADIVRRQNIWDSWGPDLKESWPHLGLIFRRRFFGVASADVRWSAV